jgi:hypothetical protein
MLPAIIAQVVPAAAPMTTVDNLLGQLQEPP